MFQDFVPARAGWCINLRKSLRDKKIKRWMRTHGHANWSVWHQISYIYLNSWHDSQKRDVCFLCERMRDCNLHILIRIIIYTCMFQTDFFLYFWKFCSALDSCIYTYLLRKYVVSMTFVRLSTFRFCDFVYFSLPPLRCVFVLSSSKDHIFSSIFGCWYI